MASDTGIGVGFTPSTLRMAKENTWVDNISGIGDKETVKICLVDGRLYFYDACSTNQFYHGNPNMVYIGKGVIFSIDGVVQKMGDELLHFYTYDKDDSNWG